MSHTASLAALACGVLEDGVRHFIAETSGIRKLTILSRGLHNDPAQFIPRIRHRRHDPCGSRHGDSLGC